MRRATLLILIMFCFELRCIGNSPDFSAQLEQELSSEIGVLSKALSAIVGLGFLFWKLDALKETFLGDPPSPRKGLLILFKGVLLVGFIQGILTYGMDFFL